MAIASPAVVGVLIVRDEQPEPRGGAGLIRQALASAAGPVEPRGPRVRAWEVEGRGLEEINRVGKLLGAIRAPAHLPRGAFAVAAPRIAPQQIAEHVVGLVVAIVGHEEAAQFVQRLFGPRRSRIVGGKLSCQRHEGDAVAERLHRHHVVEPRLDSVRGAVEKAHERLLRSAPIRREVVALGQAERRRFLPVTRGGGQHRRVGGSRFGPTARVEELLRPRDGSGLHVSRRHRGARQAGQRLGRGAGFVGQREVVVEPPIGGQCMLGVAGSLLDPRALQPHGPGTGELLFRQLRQGAFGALGRLERQRRIPHT
jgi:hypothetical protein